VATALIDGERAGGQRKTKNKQEICSRAGWGIHVNPLAREQNQEGRNMKRTAQIAVIGALLAVGIAQSYAQIPVVVSQLKVTLSGFAGGDAGAASVKITNKDIINALNLSDNGFDFSNGAKLMVAVPAEGGSPRIFVRDGGTDTDVNDFFGTDSSVVVATSNGKTQYEIRDLSFDNGVGESFNVSGFTTDKIGTVNGADTGKLTGQVTSSNATVSGTGTVAGTDTVLKGTIGTSGAKGEML
jgi:hypothetical protein